MTTSTCSSLAMSPPLFGRDMRHVRDAEGLVTFHGPVDHIDGVAACDQIDEWPGGALPPVELVLAHQIDQLALLEGIELREATAVARLTRLIDRADDGPVEIHIRRLHIEDARLEQRLLRGHGQLLIDEMSDACRARAGNERLAQRLEGLGLGRLQQAKGNG